MSAARVGVIGLGLIGGSILRKLAQLPREYSVAGFDLDAAARPGFELARSAAELAASSELVVVAVPPERTAGAVADALAANPGALVADVASVKAPVLEEVARLAPEALERFLPSHPLAGAETHRWEAARADLLDEAVWAVCPPRRDAPPEPLTRFGALVESLGARVVVCDAAEHDLAVARTSHAPHLMAVAMAAALDDPLAAALSGGAFRDMTRIARSDPGLWQQILRLNRESVRRALELDTEALAELADGDAAGRWSQARSGVELVEELRWREPEWQPHALDWPAWDELLELGRRGVAVRRLALEGDTLRFELTKRA